MSKYYILDGQKVVGTNDLYKWANWFESSDRQVDRTRIDDKMVSTVFLGIDHNFWIGGRLLIFETMVFGDSGEDIYMDRHSLWADAVAGHAKAVSWVKGGCKDDYGNSMVDTRPVVRNHDFCVNDSDCPVLQN